MHTILKRAHATGCVRWFTPCLKLFVSDAVRHALEAERVDQASRRWRRCRAVVRPQSPYGVRQTHPGVIDERPCPGDLADAAKQPDRPMNARRRCAFDGHRTANNKTR